MEKKEKHSFLIFQMCLVARKQELMIDAMYLMSAFK